MPEADRYLARVSAGLCAGCGRRKAKSGTRCRPCLAAAKHLNAGRAARLDLTGTCRKCGAKPRQEGRMHCTDCLLYFAARTAARKAA